LIDLQRQITTVQEHEEVYDLCKGKIAAFENEKLTDD